MRSSGVGVWLHSLPDGELDWNDNTKAHFHLPPDARPTLELFYQRIHPDDRQRVRDALARSARQGQPFDEFFRTVGPAGAQKWIHGVGRASLDGQGRPGQLDGLSFDVTVHVAAQQRFREFADIAPAMLWVTGLEGACIFLSRGWTAVHRPARGGGARLRLAGHGASGRPRAGRGGVPRSQRATRRVRHGASAAPGRRHLGLGDRRRPAARGAEGEFLGFVGSVTDIHDRRLAEEALRRSSERYRRLLESIDQGFCVVQILLDDAGRPADYRFVETNEVFEHLSGLHQAQGRTALEMMPGLEPFWIETYGEVALTGQPRSFSRGSEALGRWFDVFATPIGEAGERQVAILFQDVSQRVKHERQLRESEERYRAFVANSSEGIWRMEFEPPVDTRCRPSSRRRPSCATAASPNATRSFARMYGLASPADVVGHGLELMMDADDPQVRDYLLSLVALRLPRPRSGIAGAWPRTDGRSGSPTTCPAWWRTAGWCAPGARSATSPDRKRAEAALVEADRRKDEFLATLAHELRNPLAPIRASAELLRLTSGQDPRLARHAEVIGRQVGHLARMIDDLMDASRISRGKLELRLAPVVLQDVVRAALENVQAELQAGRHPLQLALPDEPIRLVGDEVRLVQVVQNLLTNAARYSADGRPIAITVEVEGEQAVLRVRDQGIGIAADQLPRLFDLFYQGGSESERATGGLGIGLPLAKLLAELHHGSVEAHSAGLGQGSEFTVRLPLPVEPVGAPDRGRRSADRRRRKAAAC